MIYKINKIQFNSRNCFVCGLDNDFGLKTRFYETAGKELIAVCTPELRHQSYPNTLHGGISSAILDETIGRAICVHYGDMVWGVTLELKVKYRRPVPYGTEIKAIARITSDKGRLFEGSGEIVLPGGEIAVSAEGTYMKRRIEDIADEGFMSNDWGFIPDGGVPAEIEL